MTSNIDHTESGTADGSLNVPLEASYTVRFFLDRTARVERDSDSVGGGTEVPSEGGASKSPNCRRRGVTGMTPGRGVEMDLPGVCAVATGVSTHGVSTRGLIRGVSTCGGMQSCTGVFVGNRG